jgi:uncharacterized delta-60 repeat protein
VNTKTREGGQGRWWVAALGALACIAFASPADAAQTLAPDPAFNAGAFRALDLGSGGGGESSELGNALVRQAGGKIVVGGSTNVGGDFDFLLARFDDDGSLDDSFGDEGIATLDLGGNETLSALKPAGGDLVIAGMSRAPGEGAGSSLVIARFFGDGTPKANFGSNGVISYPGFSAAGPLVARPDGGVVAAGIVDRPLGTNVSDIALIGVLEDGSPDPAFGPGGVRTHDFSQIDSPLVMALDTRGRFVLGGDASLNQAGNFRTLLTRFNADGSRDTSFAGGGSAVSTSGIVQSLALRPDGAIVAGWGGPGDGFPNAVFVVCQFTDGGELDRAIAGDGCARDDALGPPDDLELTNSGGILAVAEPRRGAAGGSAVVRFGPRGIRDESFGGDGVVNLSGLKANDIALDSQGRFLAAGLPSGSPPPWDLGLGRYLFQRFVPPVDLTAPQARILRVTVGARVFAEGRRRVGVRFDGFDPGPDASGGIRFGCLFDRLGWHRCSSPRLFLHVRPGRHVIRVRAIDAAGNVDAKPAGAIFRVPPAKH